MYVKFWMKVRIHFALQIFFFLSDIQGQWNAVVLLFFSRLLLSILIAINHFMNWILLSVLSIVIYHLPCEKYLIVVHWKVKPDSGMYCFTTSNTTIEFPFFAFFFQINFAKSKELLYRNDLLRTNPKIALKRLGSIWIYSVLGNWLRILDRLRSTYRDVDRILGIFDPPPPMCTLLLNTSCYFKCCGYLSNPPPPRLSTWFVRSRKSWRTKTFFHQ